MINFRELIALSVLLASSAGPQAFAGTSRSDPPAEHAKSSARVQSVAEAGAAAVGTGVVTQTAGRALIKGMGAESVSGRFLAKRLNGVTGLAVLLSSGISYLLIEKPTEEKLKQTELERKKQHDEEREHFFDQVGLRKASSGKAD